MSRDLHARRTGVEQRDAHLKSTRHVEHAVEPHGVAGEIDRGAAALDLEHESDDGPAIAVLRTVPRRHGGHAKYGSVWRLQLVTGPLRESHHVAGEPLRPATVVSTVPARPSIARPARSRLSK